MENMPSEIRRRSGETLRWIAAAVLIAAAAGCAHQPVDRGADIHAYHTEAPRDPLAERMAPVFVVYGTDAPYNRIGRPEAMTADGEPVIRVVPDRPAVYVLKQPFRTPRGAYTNLVYRVHFPGTPYRLVPFHLTAGSNVGLMVVITLDAERRPLLVTTVHTCGCYMAVTPTSHLPLDMYPPDWQAGPMAVYGETLPERLDYGAMASPRLRVHVRPAVHRVMDLEVVEAATPDKETWLRIAMPANAAAELKRLPVPGGGTTSLYYGEGMLKGHVKGSWKPWETLLLGIVSLDPVVGMDKAYEDTAVTENPFYTSLKPWNRTASDMWPFERFLAFWGWRL